MENVLLQISDFPNAKPLSKKYMVQIIIMFARIHH